MPHLNASKAIEVLSGSSARACCPRIKTVLPEIRSRGSGWRLLLNNVYNIISLVMYIYIYDMHLIYHLCPNICISVYLNIHYIHIQSLRIPPLSVKEKISRVQP